MATTTFEVDDHTAAVIAELRRRFGVKTNAAAIRRALVLANVVTDYAGADHTVTITPGDGKPAVKISLV